MKKPTLKRYEEAADKLINTGLIDYRLIRRSDLILRLIKQSKAAGEISYKEYRDIYNKWFNRYHA